MFTAVFSLPCLRPKAVNVEISPQVQSHLQVILRMDNYLDNRSGPSS